MCLVTEALCGLGDTEPLCHVLESPAFSALGALVKDEAQLKYNVDQNFCFYDILSRQTHQVDEGAVKPPIKCTFRGRVSVPSLLVC